MEGSAADVARALEGNLDTEEKVAEFLRSKRMRCEISGVVLTLEDGAWNTVHVERIDGDAGFNVSNVKLMCKLFAGTNMTRALFLDMLLSQTFVPVPEEARAVILQRKS